MVINKTFIVFSGILFLLIFGPVLYFGAFSLNIPRIMLIVILSVSSVAFLLNKHYVVPFKNEFSLLVGSLMLIVMYSLVNFIYVNDSYMLKVAILLTLYFISSILLIEMFLKKRYIVNNIFDVIFLITFFNSLIIILTGIIEPLQSVIQQYQKPTPLLELAGHYRMTALNGEAGASLSLLTLFGAITYFYSNKFGKLMRFFMFIVIVSSLIFIGRTGIMFFLIYIFVLYQAFIFRKLHIVGTLLGNVLLFIVAVSFLEWLSYIFYNVSISPSLWTSIQPIVEIYTLDSGMPAVVNFILENFLFLPTTDIGLLFGVAGLEIFDSGSLGYRSDSGYIKMIFSLGIVGLALYILHYMIFLFLSIKYLKYDKRFGYVILLILFLFIFHIKELGLGVVNFSFLIYITFFSLLYSKKNSRHQVVSFQEVKEKA